MTSFELLTSFSFRFLVCFGVWWVVVAATIGRKLHNAMQHHQNYSGVPLTYWQWVKILQLDTVTILSLISTFCFYLIIGLGLGDKC